MEARINNQVKAILKEIRKVNRLLMTAEGDTEETQRKIRDDVYSELLKEPVMPVVKLTYNSKGDIKYLTFSKLTIDNAAEIAALFDRLEGQAEFTLIDDENRRAMYEVRVFDAGKVQNENFYQLIKDFTDLEGYWLTTSTVG